MEVKFSDGMSARLSRCRRFSRSMMSWMAGSSVERGVDSSGERVGGLLAVEKEDEAVEVVAAKKRGAGDRVERAASRAAARVAERIMVETI